MKLTSTQKGDITVAMVTARFLQLGYVVLKPLSEDSRYDLVIDRGAGFERIQCKTGRLRDGAIWFNSASILAPHRGGKRRHYFGEIDAFGVFCPDTAKCYLYPASEASRSSVVMREQPTKNNQVKNVIWAKDFVL